MNINMIDYMKPLDIFKKYVIYMNGNGRIKVSTYYNEHAEHIEVAIGLVKKMTKTK